MQLDKLFFPVLAGGLLFSSAAKAQEADTLRPLAPVRLEEIVFSANKFQENKAYIAQPIRVIDEKAIKWASPGTVAGLLEQSGSAFVQKSQMGGGSPVLRGFEASRILLVVDGVRMNNAIYRAGHLQNVITLDPQVLDRVEIMYGPAGTLYGSDALGGVIVFHTRMPALGAPGKLRTQTNALYRFSSANKGHTGHADFNIGGRRWASLTSITYSDFGDLRQGADRSSDHPDFGKRNEYVERIGGKDSILKNSNPNIQKQSAYRQIDLLEKVRYHSGEHTDHVLNLQYSTSSDIPRYDRLTEYRNGKLRYAEWYYGPQERLMAAYQLKSTQLKGWFDDLLAGASYQNIGESRHQRNRGNDERQHRDERLHVAGYNIDLRKRSGRHELNIGTDGQYNKVRSTARTENILTGAEAPLDTRYPDGGSSMWYAAVYAGYLYKIIPEKLVLNAGVRLNHVALDATFKDTTFFRFPFRDAAQRNTALSGNLGLVYLPAPRWRSALSFSTGFRAPNVDDLAKVFESAGGTQLVVPNPDLKPEYTYNADYNLSYRAGERLTIEAGANYTLFRNAIVLDRFFYNEQDSIVYNGEKTGIVASQNKAKAWLYGLYASVTAQITPEISAYGSCAYTYGRYSNAQDEEVPLDHVPPFYGKAGVTYLKKKFSGELFALFNGTKKISDYNPYGEDNQQYATPGGMPGWYTLNLRLGYQVQQHVSLQVGLENVLDRNYRTFGSGISAEGRNLVLTLRGRF